MGIISLSAPCVHVESRVRDGVLVDAGEAWISRKTWQGLFWSYTGGTAAHIKCIFTIQSVSFILSLLVLCFSHQQPDKPRITRKPES